MPFNTRRLTVLPWMSTLFECENLNSATWLANNDLNITAACIHVKVIDDDVSFTAHASPCFWQLLFQPTADKKIRSADSFNCHRLGATACIRMAFKAMEMNIPFTFGDIDPMNATFAASQKEKLDSMKDWLNNPFYEYSCRKRPNQNCYVFAKKHTKITCDGFGCLVRANGKCTHTMCRGCCIKYTHDCPGVPRCSIKDHRTATASPAADGENDGGDGDDISGSEAEADNGSNNNNNNNNN
jgi:hypothetical protein